jgi:hypothetical protein
VLDIYKARWEGKLSSALALSKTNNGTNLRLLSANAMRTNMIFESSGKIN